MEQHEYNFLKQKEIELKKISLQSVRKEAGTSSLIQIEQVFWSNSGNYLIIITKNSFRFYGDSKLKFVTEFMHNDVKGVQLSQNEKYIISYNDPESTKDSESVIIWDFYTKQKLRIFTLSQNLARNFGFSFDGKYVSGIKQINGENFMYIYELPSMRVVGDPKTNELS